MARLVRLMLGLGAAAMAAASLNECPMQTLCGERNIQFPDAPAGMACKNQSDPAKGIDPAYSDRQGCEAAGHWWEPASCHEIERALLRGEQDPHQRMPCGIKLLWSRVCCENLQTLGGSIVKGVMVSGFVCDPAQAAGPRITEACSACSGCGGIIYEDSHWQLRVEMPHGRPVASGEITEETDTYQTGWVNFPDHRTFNFWYYPDDLSIYWSNPRGSTGNIWRGSLCEGGSSRRLQAETTQTETTQGPTTQAPTTQAETTQTETTQGPTTQAPATAKCEDLVPDWADDAGNGCEVYATLSGGRHCELYGWEDYGMGEADDVCCACGGGTTKSTSTTALTTPSLASEEDNFPTGEAGYEGPRPHPDRVNLYTDALGIAGRDVTPWPGWMRMEYEMFWVNNRYMFVGYQNGYPVYRNLRARELYLMHWDDEEGGHWGLVNWHLGDLRPKIIAQTPGGVYDIHLKDLQWPQEMVNVACGEFFGRTHVSMTPWKVERPTTELPQGKPVPRVPVKSQGAGDIDFGGPGAWRYE